MDAKSPKVLVVDDDDYIRLSLVAVLGATCHDVVEAGSVGEAIAGLERRGKALDVVVTDYRLRQGETGMDVIRAVRMAYGASVPALLLTGDAGTTEIGMDNVGVLHKPVSPADLNRALTGSRKV